MRSTGTAKDKAAIPSIDLGVFLNGTEKEQQAIARHVDEICRSIGFLVIENHGVDPKVMQDAWSMIRDFFELPIEEKLKARSDDPFCPRGYFPMEAEALAKSRGVDTPPDIKERFGIGPMSRPPHEMSDEDFDFHCGTNLWPEAPAQFRKALTDYFNAMEDLGAKVLQLFAAALDLPHDYFDGFHTFPRSALTCNHYPYTDEPLLPDQKGAGEHSDYGTVTILRPDPNVAGLEIKLPSGEWAAAPLVDDKFIVNIGDLMARWTNDRWVSTMHRVVKPNAAEGRAGRRHSMAFFMNTNYDAEIECIPTCLAPEGKARYDKVRAGDYLKARFTAALNAEKPGFG
jgi:isopenicillin N synthase-like dioxygenase